MNSAVEWDIKHEINQLTKFSCMFQEHIEEESVILACVRSFHKVFSRYIEAGEMFQETQLSEEMTGLVIT